MARRTTPQTSSPDRPLHWGQEWRHAAEDFGIKREMNGPIPQDDWDDQTDWTSPPPEQAPKMQVNSAKKPKKRR